MAKTWCKLYLKWPLVMLVYKVKKNEQKKDGTPLPFLPARLELFALSEIPSSSSRSAASVSWFHVELLLRGECDMRGESSRSGPPYSNFDRCLPWSLLSLISLFRR